MARFAQSAGRADAPSRSSILNWELGMKATELLQKQHREIEHLLERLRTSGPQEAQALRDELANLLVSHTKIENDHFYPALRAIAPELVLEAIEEHGLADFQLARDLGARSGAADIHARTAVLAQIVLAHIRKEENDLFRRAEIALTNQELAEIGEELAHAFMHVQRLGYRKLLSQALAEHMPPLARSAVIGERKSARRASPKKMARKAAIAKHAATKRAATKRRAPKRGATAKHAAQAKHASQAKHTAQAKHAAPAKRRATTKRRATPKLRATAKRSPARKAASKRSPAKRAVRAHAKGQRVVTGARKGQRVMAGKGQRVVHGARKGQRVIAKRAAVGSAPVHASGKSAPKSRGPARGARTRASRRPAH
ncbi:Histone H1-like protein HC2 [Minicystis rosea]|nr:Histone H1-like protein HC2 [Minicystis rosea]